MSSTLSSYVDPKYSFRAIPKSTDHIYIDLTKYNDQHDTAQCVFQENLTNILVSKPEDYNITIARIDLPMKSVPLFKFVDGAYQIAIGVGGRYGTYNAQTVVFNRLKDPSDPTRDYIYCIYDFFDCINTAFAAAIAAVIPGESCFFDYDTMGTVSLFATSGFANPNVSITCNNDLASKFGSFDWTFYPGGYNNQPYSAWRFNVIARSLNIIDSLVPYGGVTGTTVPFIVNNGNGTDPGSFLEFNNLVCVCNFPVENEMSINGVPGSKVNYTPILTDFIISVNDPQGLAGRLVYQPELYRLISLKGATPIQSIFIQWFLRSRDGSLVPLNLVPYDNASMKILILKKGRVS